MKLLLFYVATLAIFLLLQNVKSLFRVDFVSFVVTVERPGPAADLGRGEERVYVLSTISRRHSAEGGSQRNFKNNSRNSPQHPEC